MNTLQVVVAVRAADADRVARSPDRPASEPNMTRLHQQIETRLPLDAAFAFVADFANAMRWDPGVTTSEPVDDRPVGLGARYRLGVRMRGRVTPMEYRITEFDAPRRVVLTGTGPGVSAVDEIRFERAGTVTRIDYTADIRLGGLLRIAQPFLGAAFAKIGRDALDGMQRALDAQAVELVGATASR
jgi:carbon monoxide dehydrogenase subunit G